MAVARMAMMAIVAINSTSVNPRRRCVVLMNDLLTALEAP